MESGHLPEAPSEGVWYPLSMGNTFLESSTAAGDRGQKHFPQYYTLHYSFKPASIDETKPGTLRHGPAAKPGTASTSSNKVLVQLANNQPGKPSLEFEGHDEACRELDCLLFFDGQSVRLERLHHSVRSIQLVTRNLPSRVEKSVLQQQQQLHSAPSSPLPPDKSAGGNEAGSSSLPAILTSSTSASTGAPHVVGQDPSLNPTTRSPLRGSKVPLSHNKTHEDSSTKQGPTRSPLFGRPTESCVKATGAHLDSGGSNKKLAKVHLNQGVKEDSSTGHPRGSKVTKHMLPNQREDERLKRKLQGESGGGAFAPQLKLPSSRGRKAPDGTEHELTGRDVAKGRAAQGAAFTPAHLPSPALEAEIERKQHDGGSDASDGEEGADDLGCAGEPSLDVDVEEEEIVVEVEEVIAEEEVVEYEEIVEEEDFEAVIDSDDEQGANGGPSWDPGEGSAPRASSAVEVGRSGIDVHQAGAGGDVRKSAIAELGPQSSEDGSSKDGSDGSSANGSEDDDEEEDDESLSSASDI